MTPRASYLRQAVHQLREALPDEVRIVSDPAHVSLEESLNVSSESARLEASLAEAARLQGEERIAATLRALAIVDRGEYLPGLSSNWVAGATRTARRGSSRTRAWEPPSWLCDGPLRGRRPPRRRHLEHDPFREGAHRLEMRIANAVGDEDRVIAAYRRCELALGELGTAPSTSTRQLLETLRR